MTTVRSDVYSRVTDQIVAELEAGVRPWVQPWNASHAAGEVSRPLRFNAVPYRGINVVLLWLAALHQQFTCPLWMTYKQAAELGGQVRRGARGSLVVYADKFTRREADDKRGTVGRPLHHFRGRRSGNRRTRTGTGGVAIMPKFFPFTRPRFTARIVARVIGHRLGRRLTYQEPDEMEDLDGSVDITGRVHVQVGADYLVVCAWESDGVMKSWPPRRNIPLALRDLHQALEQYPEAAS